jgi:hypothetical protein
MLMSGGVFSSFQAISKQFLNSRISRFSLQITSSVFGLRIVLGDLALLEIGPTFVPSCSNLSYRLPCSYHSVPLLGIVDMVQTRHSSGEGGSNPPDPIVDQLATIAAKLESIESMKEDIAALKFRDRYRGSWFEEGDSSWRHQSHPRPFNKIDFLTFSGVIQEGGYSRLRSTFAIIVSQLI